MGGGPLQRLVDLNMEGVPLHFGDVMNLITEGVIEGEIYNSPFPSPFGDVL